MKQIVSLVPQITVGIVEAIQHVPQEGTLGVVMKQIVAPVPQIREETAEAIQLVRPKDTQGVEEIVDTPVPQLSPAPAVIHVPAPSGGVHLSRASGASSLSASDEVLFTRASGVPNASASDGIFLKQAVVPVPQTRADIAVVIQPVAAVITLEFVDELQRREEAVPPTIAAARDKFRGDLEAYMMIEHFGQAPHRWERPGPHTGPAGSDSVRCMPVAHHPSLWHGFSM